MGDLQKHLYRNLISIVIVLIAGATIFYHFVEKWSWIDAYFFCVTTLSTVGYGNLVPHTDIGKLFTTLYIIVGIGIFSTFITVTIKRRSDIRKRKVEGNVNNP